MGELYRNRDRDWPGDSGGGYANHGGLNLAERGDAVSGDVVMDGGSGGRRPLPGRILKGITCFKCTQMGHLASQCPNPSVPGNVRSSFLSIRFQSDLQSGHFFYDRGVAWNADQVEGLSRGVISWSNV